MTSFIIIGILFVLGLCAVFLIFPPKSQAQIKQEDEEEAKHWAEYAQSFKDAAVKRSIDKKFNGTMNKHFKD